MYGYELKMIRVYKVAYSWHMAVMSPVYIYVPSTVIAETNQKSIAFGFLMTPVFVFRTGWGARNWSTLID